MDTAQWLQILHDLDENQVCLFCGGLLAMPAPQSLPLRDKTKKSIKQSQNRHHFVPQRYRHQTYKHPQDVSCISEVSDLFDIAVGVHPACHVAFNRQFDKNGQVGFRHFFVKMQKVDWGYLIYMPRGQP